MSGIRGGWGYILITQMTGIYSACVACVHRHTMKTKLEVEGQTLKVELQKCLEGNRGPATGRSRSHASGQGRALVGLWSPHPDCLLIVYRVPAHSRTGLSTAPPCRRSITVCS
jgi:hypothetical protein